MDIQEISFTLDALNLEPKLTINNETGDATLLEPYYLTVIARSGECCELTDATATYYLQCSNLNIFSSVEQAANKIQLYKGCVNELTKIGLFEIMQSDNFNKMVVSSKPQVLVGKSPPHLMECI